MGTRSLIGVEVEENCFEYVYCHWDGYPSNNGNILFEHYQDEEKAKELVAHGAMSSLNPRIHPDPSAPHSFKNEQSGVTVFYHRDRGEDLEVEKGSEADMIRCFQEGWTEYAYLRRKNGTWQAMTKYGDDIKFIWFDLDDVLNNGAWDYDEDE